MKELKATRVPPGDRWAITDGDDQIYASLTEVLNNNSYDVWALGSSTVLQFREEMFSSSFYNLGLMISPISDIKTFLPFLLRSAPAVKLFIPLPIMIIS